MSLVIRECTISELENSPNISALLEEYASESSIAGLPHPFAKADTYKHLEKSKAIHIVGAFSDDILAGYIIVLAPVLPHYSVRVAVGESFFVAKAYRKTGAGLKLLRQGEKYAREAGAVGMLMSAPINGSLAEVLPGVGYKETNRVFFKSMATEVCKTVPSMGEEAIKNVRELESMSLKMPQVDIKTSHTFHAGMYARTIMIPKNTILTGALIKIATLLIVQGNVIVYIGGESLKLNGYNVLPACENRKQAFYAVEDTYLTMVFPTKARDISEAEDEFTDEASMLMSRNADKIKNCGRIA